MAITRWDPFREVVALQNRMNSLFRDLNEGDSPLTTASFVPAVDIYEDAQKVMLKLEVPGIEEKDLDVRVENNTRQSVVFRIVLQIDIAHPFGFAIHDLVSAHFHLR